MIDLLLFITALVASIIDTLVGGGGLICLPALLMLGLPPHIALGTNKLQGAFGTASASFRFLHHSHLHLSDIWVGALFTFLGGLIGTWAVSEIDASFLRQLLPPLLLLILCYILIQPYFATLSLRHPVKNPYLIGPLGLLLGFYDGFLGPGIGSFWVVLLMLLTPLTLRESTMRTKVFNFASTFASLLYFALTHQVNYRFGLVMAAGQIIGAQLGAHLIIQKGSRLIRPLFLIVVTLMLLLLSYQVYFKD